MVRPIEWPLGVKWLSVRISKSNETQVRNVTVLLRCPAVRPSCLHNMKTSGQATWDKQNTGRSICETSRGEHENNKSQTVRIKTSVSNSDKIKLNT